MEVDTPGSLRAAAAAAATAAVHRHSARDKDSADSGSALLVAGGRAGLATGRKLAGRLQRAEGGLAAGWMESAFVAVVADSAAGAVVTGRERRRGSRRRESTRSGFAGDGAG